MEFTISFDKIINLMLKNNIGLSQYFKNRSHNFFERYWDFELYYIMHRYSRYSSNRNGLVYLRNLLRDERAFESPLIYLLFKAFVYAEMKFIKNYIPQNSHEERLTGHLVSEITNSLDIISNEFEQKALEIYQTKVDLEFHYADLSSNKNEKFTGADLGIIFHINLPDYPEKVTVAIIQAKKFDRFASIDLKQINTLKKFAEKSGFYCFYDMNKSDRNSPLIQNVDSIESIISNNHRNTRSKSLKRSDIVDRYDGGIPLSVFLIFEMLNLDNNLPKSFSNIWEAKSFIDKQADEFSLSRVLTLSVGGISNSNQDLGDISDLFSFENYTDDE